jgi:hypothetical protein
MAKESLESTPKKATDTVHMFISRFMKRLAVYHITSKHSQQHQTHRQVRNRFLDQLYVNRFISRPSNFGVAGNLRDCPTTSDTEKQRKTENCPTKKGGINHQQVTTPFR